MKQIEAAYMPSDADIKAAQFYCALENPKYPFTWTREYAIAYLRCRYETNRKAVQRCIR